jgi:hypothetical protein
LTEYEWRYRVASGKGSLETQRKLSDDLKARCRIYFPTHETVTKSKARVWDVRYMFSWSIFRLDLKLTSLDCRYHLPPI